MAVARTDVALAQRRGRARVGQSSFLSLTADTVVPGQKALLLRL